MEHYAYVNGDNGTTVEHLKVNGGGHTWPGENTNAPGVNRDINGCVEIWKFFSKYDINGYRGSSMSAESINSFSPLTVYPNPAQDYIHLQATELGKEVRIINYLGQEFHLPTRFADEHLEIDIQMLPSGAYSLITAHEGKRLQATFIKQ